MMHVLPCAQVREDLAAYHDGELALEAQVAIQNHLQDCVSCRLEAAALDELSDAFRTIAGAASLRTQVQGGALTAAVLERVRVERQFSWTTQIRTWFEDMHLVWAGLGASLAMVFCVFASAGVLHAASQERPDSLAGIISTIARGATDPLQLLTTADSTDRLLDATEALQAAETADLMLSAFVTRDGRIQNVSLLEEEARALRLNPDVVGAMIEAASRARFSPSHTSGYPGGFNVVWLVTSTTVKGLSNYDLYLLSPPRLATPVFTSKPHSTSAPTPPTAKSNTTMGDDGLDA